MSEEPPAADLLGLTAEIVAAHVSNNPVSLADLPNLIQEVYRTLAAVGQPAAKPQPERPQPAVPVKKSITPEYLICLEDGKKLKMLKRHLQTSYGLTPDAYRAKWGLSREYPMVAPYQCRGDRGMASGATHDARRAAALLFLGNPDGADPEG